MTIKESGFCYPNKMGRIFIMSVEETMGQEATKTIFNLAGIPAEYYPPPNNFAKEFDFAYYGAIGATLEKMYGHHAERGLGLHVGRASFIEGLAEFGSLIGAGDLAFKTLPLKIKTKLVLKGMGESFAKFSDQLTTVEEADDHFIYTIHRCPVCWGRSSSKPVCYAAIGLIEGGLNWVNADKKFLVKEVACHAAGDKSCIFHIQKEPLP